MLFCHLFDLIQPVVKFWRSNRRYYKCLLYKIIFLLIPLFNEFRSNLDWRDIIRTNLFESYILAVRITLSLIFITLDFRQNFWVKFINQRRNRFFVRWDLEFRKSSRLNVLLNFTCDFLCELFPKNLLQSMHASFVLRNTPFYGSLLKGQSCLVIIWWDIKFWGTLYTFAFWFRWN